MKKWKVALLLLCVSLLAAFVCVITKTGSRFEGVGEAGQEIFFPTELAFDAIENRYTWASLLGYPDKAVQLVTSGKGTYAGRSDTRPMSNAITLPEYIYIVTGHDIRVYLEEANVSKLNTVKEFLIEDKPMSHSWLAYNSLVRGIEPSKSLLLIFPSELVPHQTPFLEDQAEYNYLFIKGYNPQLIQPVYFDGCARFLREPFSDRSRFIGEFALRPDQLAQAISIYSVVAHSVCR